MKKIINAKAEEDKHMLIATKFFVIIVGVLSAICGLASTNIYDLTIFAFTLHLEYFSFPL